MVLGAAEVAAALAAAGEVSFGLKVGLRPTDQPASVKLAAIGENANVVLTAKG